MASSTKLIISLAIAVILLPTIAMATDYIVGDDKGWTTNFDYQNWAKDKVFRVGDTLVFNYKAPNHDVYKVNGTDFKACNAPEDAEKFVSGNDKITLASAGNKWYLCGKEFHCGTGQKLSITVLDSAPPSSAVSGTFFFSSAYLVLMALLVVFLSSIYVV